MTNPACAIWWPCAKPKQQPKVPPVVSHQPLSLRPKAMTGVLRGMRVEPRG
jgi:hypothetical protein